MPTFSTPHPISLTLDIVIGDVRIIAGDRADTVVEVRPGDRSRDVDVQAVEQTRVEYADGALLVKGPKRIGYLVLGPNKNTPSLEVQIELPAGSRVRGSLGMGDFHGTGRLGECEIHTGAGSIRLHHTGGARLKTGAGDILANRVAGDAEATTGIGAVHLREIDGTAVVKNSCGDNRLGQVTGAVRVKTASGDIVIDQAHGDVQARTAAGKIRVGEVRHGSVVLESGAGELEVGVQEGAAAWLDVRSTAGRVHNQLDASGPPAPDEQTVEVRARTGIGDIVISRSTPVPHE
ncbi:hypothetical protein DPM19_26355 [Actinomadura craniellae]|uniref:DUF4097 domain-containing protein n=2 Tax=Actinomadura craniellae TaxID=2231787 RepID=A0A365GZP8_9ACTN|nr:hypothetical protein DPM19_26355 [Actinomadura craniellae]